MTVTHKKIDLATWAVALTLALLPLIYPGLFSTTTDLIPKRLSFFIGICAISLAWIIHNKTHNLSMLQTRLVQIGALYVLWNFLSLFWATNVFTGWVEALQLLGLFVLFAATTALNFRRNIYVISQAATLGSFIVSLIGIAQYLGLGFETILSVGLPSSTFIFRNLASAYLLGVIPLIIVALYHAPSSLKILNSASLATALLFLFYTRTRGAWVALLGALLLLFLILVILPQNRIKIKAQFLVFIKSSSVRLGLGIAVVVLVIGTLLPASTSQNVIQQFDEQKATPTAAVSSLLTPGSDRGRFTMWRHTVSMIMDHPILGVGIDNWEYIYPIYDRGEKITYASEPVRPHNDLLWIASELGLIGLAGYIALLVIALKNIWQQLKSDDSLIPAMAFLGIVAFVIYSCFSFPKEQIMPAMFFWFYLGIINVTPSANTQKKQPIIPLLGFAVCLCGIYISIRNIQFDQYYQTARVYESRQQWQNAHAAIVKALDAGPFDHRAKFLQGQYLQKMNRLDASAQAYELALEAHPNYAHTHHNLGGVLAARGNLQKAILHLQKAVEIRPQYHQAQLHLGNAYIATKQFGKATEIFQNLIKANPNSAEAYTNLGSVFLQQNRFKPAISAFERAIQIQPQNAQAYNNLGYAYEQIGQIPKAIMAYENLLKYWQGDEQYRTTVTQHVTTLKQQVETP